jgi:colanic acid biosynthesis glycosyl transferase WcaI
VSVVHITHVENCSEGSSRLKPEVPASSPANSLAAPGNRRISVFYHYLFPDNVVSAVHVDELCQGLVQRGWDVTAFPANRGCRDENLTYEPLSLHKGVRLQRLWRPRFRQSSSSGRLLNAFWMIARWSLLAFRPNPPAAIIVGTDPILSVTVAIVWRLVRPRTQILHWVFDLYPEAAYADGLLAPEGIFANLLAKLLRRAYAACDALIDIGPCMRARLGAYPLNARRETIVPWALEEPAAVLPDAPEEREQIFGSTRIAMLYSGNFGRAHQFEDFLALARALHNEDAIFAFSVRGNREEELANAIAGVSAETSCPVRLVPFAPQERLLDRLAAPDIHLLSLIPSWTGLVVPSKFFGALAAGRPVLFSGSPDSSIAEWIMTFDLGWVLTPENVESIAAQVVSYVNDEARVVATKQRCRAVYQAYFSREASLDHMHTLLVDLVSRPHSPGAEALSSAAR